MIWEIKQQMKYLFLLLQVTVDTNVTVWARKEEKGASWQQKVRFAPQIFSFHLCQHDKYRLHPGRNKSWTKQSSFPNKSFWIFSIFVTGQNSFFSCRCEWTFFGLHFFRYIFCQEIHNFGGVCVFGIWWEQLTGWALPVMAGRGQLSHLYFASYDHTL